MDSEKIRKHRLRREIKTFWIATKIQFAKVRKWTSQKPKWKGITKGSGFYGPSISLQYDRRMAYRPGTVGGRSGYTRVRRTLMKFKKQLKKQTKTIDKLTDLLSRYDKQLTKKVRIFFWSLSGQMSSKVTQFYRRPVIRTNHKNYLDWK